jgi:hypothetical protein
VADVLRHGCDVDGWMRKLWAGESLPFSNFDPTATPHEFVVAGRVSSDRDVRDHFLVSAETMAADVGHCGPERWGVTSFSPLGAVPWWLSALHVFYDSWLHERDALLPLGIGVAAEPDEALPVLAYSLALVGTLVREPTDAVIAGVRVVTGEAPVVATPVTSLTEGHEDRGAIIDALSGRGSLEGALAGTDAEIVHRLGGLARLFLAAV